MKRRTTLTYQDGHAEVFTDGDALEVDLNRLRERHLFSIVVEVDERIVFSAYDDSQEPEQHTFADFMSEPKKKKAAEPEASQIITRWYTWCQNEGTREHPTLEAQREHWERIRSDPHASYWTQRSRG